MEGIVVLVVSSPRDQRHGSDESRYRIDQKSGNCDNTLRVQTKDSISMNFDVLITRTIVSFQSSLPVDELIINGYYIRRVD